MEHGVEPMQQIQTEDAWVPFWSVQYVTPLHSYCSMFHFLGEMFLCVCPRMIAMRWDLLSLCGMLRAACVLDGLGEMRPGVRSLLGTHRRRA